jgi:Pentapeptide repeats (8 copies)
MANKEYLTQLKQRCVDILATAHHALASGAAYAYAWGRTWITERQAGESIRHTSQRVMARLRSTPSQELARRYLPLLVGVSVLLLLFVFWKLPQWYAASWDKLDPKDIAKLESDTRTTLVQVVGGLFVLAGLFFTAKAWRTAQEGQITDRFTKAINQLGETGPEKLAIRLGGIYALERIARDSARDHWPIMEILTAYVREHAPWPPKDIPPLADDLSTMKKSPEGEDQLGPKPMPDIQAILTVLGRRTRTFGKGEDQRLNLSSIDLRHAALRGAQLQGADLSVALLQGANLQRAQLQDADLSVAQLQGANLSDAGLQGADLRGAQLQGANLQRANLKGAIGLTVDI